MNHTAARSQTLTYQTQQRVNDIIKMFARTNGIPEHRTAEYNAIEPSVAQTLSDRITHSLAFLEQINTFPVTQTVGQKILMGVNEPISSRTETNQLENKQRIPQEGYDPDEMTYTLHKIDSDIAIPYKLLDSWAQFPNFLEKLTQHTMRQMALDRICCAWNGVRADKNTDRKTNPLLEDLAPGWLADVRSKHPEQILTEGAEGTGKIKLGAGGDYETLDAAVSDIANLIDPRLRGAFDDWVCIIGDELIAWDAQRTYTLTGQTPTEKILVPDSVRSYGGHPRLISPYFPPTGIVVTSPKLLSVYHQADSWRRSMTDEPRFNQLASFNSRNEGYFVEDARGFAAVEPDHVEYGAFNNPASPGKAYADPAHSLAVTASERKPKTSAEK